MRVVQPGADDQPSSITSISAPLARQVGLRIEERPGDRQDQRGGQQLGAATRATTGILLGVCSVGSSPISSRIAGKRTSLGSGGIMRKQPVDQRQRQQDEPACRVAANAKAPRLSTGARGTRVSRRATLFAVLLMLGARHSSGAHAMSTKEDAPLEWRAPSKDAPSKDA